MSAKGSLGEQLFFAAEQAERREKIRQKLAEAAAKLAEQKAIADTLHTSDAELAERIQALGFDGDSARVFDLLPLIHVSWADGKIQRQERATILSVLQARDVEPGSEAFLLIETLLESKPAPAFMEVSLQLLRDLVATRGEEAASLVDLCVQVADASGGVLGLGNRICAEERDLIEQIAEMLGSEAQEQFKKRLE